MYPFRDNSFRSTCKNGDTIPKPCKHKRNAKRRIILQQGRVRLKIRKPLQIQNSRTVEQAAQACNGIFFTGDIQLDWVRILASVQELD